MARIPVYTVETAPEAGRETLAAFEKALGTVPNLFGGLAHSPALINGFGGLFTALNGPYATLDGRARRAIALSTSAANGCDYCQAAHTYLAQAEGMALKETVSIRSGAPDADDRLALLLAVTREASENQGRVSDDTWRRAIEGGWSEVQLIEGIGHVVLTVFTNYFNTFVQTDIDFPDVPALAKAS